MRLLVLSQPVWRSGRSRPVDRTSARSQGPEATRRGKAAGSDLSHLTVLKPERGIDEEAEMINASVLSLESKFAMAVMWPLPIASR